MKNIKRISRIIITVALLGICIFSLVMIIKWFTNTRSNKKLLNEINTRIVIEDIHDGKSTIDFDYLKKINSDTVGYLSIDGVDINYPVVEGDNNDYYLNHSFDKTKNVAGWIFMDYRNSSSIFDDKNTVIYGHNMKDGSMFGKLKQLKNSDIDTIYYYDEENKITFKIISMYEIDAEDYYITTNMNDNEYLKFLNTIKGRSIKKIDYNPSLEDKIITLSTCSSSKKRFVVHAALLQD